MPGFKKKKGLLFESCLFYLSVAPPPFPLSPAAANESGVVSRDQLKAAGGQVSGTRTWAGPAGGGGGVGIT